MRKAYASAWSVACSRAWNVVYNKAWSVVYNKAWERGLQQGMERGITAYFNQAVKYGASTEDAISDAAIEFNVTEEYIKNIIEDTDHTNSYIRPFPHQLGISSFNVTVFFSL